jgi:hypothetical protein
MKLRCFVTRQGDRWRARHESADLGKISVTADSRDEAVEKIVGELRYRLELCPCTGESYRHLDVETVNE